VSQLVTVPDEVVTVDVSGPSAVTVAVTPIDAFSEVHLYYL